MFDRGFIYGLVCPTDGRVRYVGQTRSKSVRQRLGDHLRESSYNKPVYTRKERWIRKVSQYGKITVVLLEELRNVSQEQLDEAECRWMKNFQNLTNTATGGTSGHVFSDETRRKMSEGKLGSKNPMFGTTCVMPIETRMRISESLRNSERHKAAMKSPETRRKIAEAQFKNKWLIVRQDTRDILGSFDSASQVAEFLNSIGVKSNTSNVKNARRRMKAIGKQSPFWVFVCYENDFDFLKNTVEFNSLVRLGPTKNTTFTR